MRIGLDARYLYEYFTGIGRYSCNLIRHLALLESEHEYVVFKNKNRLSPIVAHPRFKEVRVGLRPVSPGTLGRFYFDVRRERVELLHSHFPVAPLIRSFKSVVTVHDLQAVKVREFSGKRLLPVKWAFDCFYRLAYPLSMKRADKIIAISHTTAEEVSVYYGIERERIKVIYEAVEECFRPVQDENALQALREKYGLPPHFFLYVGSTRPHKNLKGLVRSFHLFCREYEEAEKVALVIAGAGDRFMAEVEELVGKLNLRRRVFFPGLIADEDLPALYSAARLFILVSTNEGFGLPCLEAAACGTPVIASGVGSLPEVLGEAALLVNPHDEEEVAQALARLWKDGSLQEELREKGLKQVKNFSWEKTARQTLEVYEEVMDLT